MLRKGKLIIAVALFWISNTTLADLIELSVTFQSHGDSVNALSLHPSKNIIASGDDDGIVFVWNSDTNTIIHRLEEGSSSVNSIAFNHGGTQFIAGFLDGKIRIWDTDTGYQQKVIDIDEGFASAVNAIAFSHDGKFVVSGSKTIKLWEISTSKLIRVMQADGGMMSMIHSVSISPDDKIIASGRNSMSDHIKLWELGTGNLLKTLDEHNAYVSSLKFTSSPSVLVSGSGDATIKIWDMDNNVVRKTLKGHKDGWTSGVTSIDVSHDDKLIASVADTDNTLKLWDLGKAQEVGTIKAHDKSVYSVKFNYDNNFVATGSADKQVKVWKINIPNSGQ